MFSRGSFTKRVALFVLSLSSIMLIIALISLLAFSGSHALPIEQESENITLVAEVLDDGRILVEDMIMTFEQFNSIYPHVETNGDSKTTIHKRVAVPSQGSLWPNARIPYKWHSNLPGSQASVIQAMNTWMSKTCVKFVPATASDRYYMVIQDNNRVTCNADLGFQNRIEGMYLHQNCFDQATILHELGHILGLIHEHQHPDRDRYLTIYWQNIDPTYAQWFNVDGASHGVGYDIYSIMHYTSNSFVKSGCNGCKSMTSKYGSQYDQYMGTRTTLSTYSDIPIINKLYCSSG